MGWLWSLPLVVARVSSYREEDPHECTNRRRRPHVVILGGGFAGLGAVRALRKADVDVTLVDQRTYNTFQPLLYQVATAGLNAGDVTFFLRATRMKQLNLSFRHGEVDTINTAENSVHFTDGSTLEYDYLVIGTGVTTNYFGTPGPRRTPWRSTRGRRRWRCGTRSSPSSSTRRPRGSSSGRPS